MKLKLQYDLANIGKLDPYAAVKYIRFAVGYEDYLKEYAKTRSIDFDELKEVVDEVQELAKGFNSYREWKKFIQVKARIGANMRVRLSRIRNSAVWALRRARESLPSQ